MKEKLLMLVLLVVVILGAYALSQTDAGQDFLYSRIPVNYSN